MRQADKMHRFCLCMLAFILSGPQLYAQIIEGDVYGGGKEGHITGNDANPVVTVSGDAHVRTVFGGGLNGTVAGSTTVNIQGGTIGAAEYSGTASGGVYGAGEGASATVSGDATVNITGGTIVNNVYGGGKMAMLKGSTSVQVSGGTMQAQVYGGARAADIIGYSYLHVYGTPVINSVFGGNDIGGDVLNSGNGTPDFYNSVNASIKSASVPNAFVQLAGTPFIANAFAGGNGNYTYTASGDALTVTLPNDASGDSQLTFTVNSKPELPRTFLDISGGTFYYVFGGGNFATITENTNIYLHENTAAPIATLDNSQLAFMPAMDEQAYASGDAGITFKKQIYHLFGGNNLADMSIRPSWNLQSGLVGSLYSGGNKGDMTHPNGIILAVTSDGMDVENVYGGCRMSNVHPKLADGADAASITSETLDGYTYPAGYSTRVRIAGGRIGTVYGGNDISGDVYFGTNVVIQSDIVNDVYGAGNGSYPYTDNDPNSDYYFDAEGTTGAAALAKLNLHRPNSEKAMITLMGQSASTPTYIGGSVYCGGNSATLRSKSGDVGSGVGATITIGSNVIANRVFMGSNGANMITESVLRGINTDNTAVDLTVSEQFDEYMKGVEVGVRPNVAFTSDYVAKSSKIGSFYCGGNVGSMSAAGTFDINFQKELIIFDKLVAGCNNANVEAKEGLNAYHMGGLTTHSDLKVKLDINGLLIEPRVLTYDAVQNKFNFTWSKYNESGKSSYLFLKGGNIYGGCYESGYVDGNVEINLKSDVITPETYAEMNTIGTDWDHHSKEQSISTLSIFGGGYGEQSEIWGDVNINLTDNARFLKIRGGSEKGWIGKMLRDENGQLVAGTDFDAIQPDGTIITVPVKQFETAYNTTVTMNATVLRNNGSVIPNIGDICGGGYEGVVTGNSRVVLNSGCAYNVFGGASNADIYGGAEVFVGRNAAPYVTQAIYGGNDFGGQIMGTIDHSVTVAGESKTITSNTYIDYVSGEIGYATGEQVASRALPDANFGIFGAANGNYNYESTIYTAPKTKPNMLSVLTASGDALAYNSFVNVSSASTKVEDKVYNIYGGGEGYAGKMGVADTHNTYVLFNAQNADKRGGNENYIAQFVYGGGNCSKTNHSQLDAYGGYAKYIFGGCHGSNSRDQQLTYMGETATVNLYTIESGDMDVFGSGALSGTKETFVNVLGGRVHDVYGATYEEGITYQSNVNVPETSTAQVHAIFGGGMGLYEQFACDTYISLINFDSENARVSSSIYGGNNQQRMTRNAFVNISVPVRNSEGNLIDVYGAGYGAGTFAYQTYVNLLGTANSANARVKNVYGGGQDGMVFNAPTLAKFLTTKDYYATDAAGPSSDYLSDVETTGFDTWKSAKVASGDAVIASGIKYSDLTNVSLVATTDNSKNTNVLIPQGAQVDENAYGGGYGTAATVAGQTSVQLLGGKVAGDIYGGGYGGDVKLVAALVPSEAQHISTNILLDGGSTTNAYGGGYEGQVDGDANTVVGHSNCDGTGVTFLAGDPVIERSLYGGGQKGAVTGTALMDFYNGHVGYKYDASLAASGDASPYVANIDLKAPQDSLLLENGNVFGGGYGEGAYTTTTRVNMWNGTIRNSIYGGGEIASVGHGKTKAAEDGSMNRILDLSETPASGDAHLSIYGGKILRDVFGGGRGYSYNLNGNELTGTRLYTDGYVFGSTEVKVHGGEIGTEEGVDLGYGNVFGGGNVGFVYSIDGTKSTEDGYYYGADGDLTEDCRVVISPYCRVTADAGVTIDGTTYPKCDYVPTEELNKLQKNDPKWGGMDWESGVTVWNAVFAGGNVTRGSDKLYANTTTIYGNVTAALNDVYHRDLISIGSDYVGGLYGDGNLTLVDGYREIAIVNFGTDYYTLRQEITVDEYNNMSDRERAYFSLEYKCTTAYSGHEVGSTIQEEQYNSLPENEKANWEQAGFCTMFSGRIINTIQRADFCGVHGSRVVLQGAQDRVIDVMDYTKYAINRVGEVSLNRKTSVIPEDSGIEEEKYHGCYFGMYNTVNLLQSLTSDVQFNATRYSKNSRYEVDQERGFIDDKNEASGDATPRSYYQFKVENLDTQYRNNGTSDNEIAMAQGVYLELVDHIAETEETIDGRTYQAGDKVYGPVTGVIGINLINATEDMGGGYVYAKNIHGVQTYDPSKLANATLSSYNSGAMSKVAYSYAPAASGDALQTSGNFVHYLKQIVDECYPNSSSLESPAHFWFLRGKVFVYEQNISAYSGSSTAYKSNVQIPLTISSGANGKLRIMDIKPNLFAYYKVGSTALAPGETFKAGNVTYGLNDVISYWDWSNLTPEEQTHFVDMTYVCKENLYSDAEHTSLAVAKDKVMLKAEYETYMNVDYYDGNGIARKGSDLIRVSNGTDHTNGFILTAALANPSQWDDRYTKRIDTSTGVKTVKDKSEYIAEGLTSTDYAKGPTYFIAESGVRGQRLYNQGDILPKETVDAYEALGTSKPTVDQAEVLPAYIAIENVSYLTSDGNTRNVQAGVAISESIYTYLAGQPDAQSKFKPAYVCAETFQKDDAFVLTDELYSETEYNELTDEQKKHFSKAYYCDKTGNYGGVLFTSNQNYDALGSFSLMSKKEDRDAFKFNFDGLDLLYNDLQAGWSTQYAELTPGTENTNGLRYTKQIPIQYTARCTQDFTFTDEHGIVQTFVAGQTYSSEQFEDVPNEMSHYSRIQGHAVSGDATHYCAYVVKEAFTLGSNFYQVGATLSETAYQVLSSDIQSNNITIVTLPGSGDYYYCRESYKVGERGEGQQVHESLNSPAFITIGQEVPFGTVIQPTDFDDLPNYQQKFVVMGETPMESSTFYVPRMADINNQTTERIITLMYQYQYEEMSADGKECELVSERHVLNIHVQFKSGIPVIGELKAPSIVLPGSTIGLKQPLVAQGAYEIIGGGWEIYENKNDADNHENGIAYSNNTTPMYFYQDGYYVAYYTKTFLGKTYSNAVPFSVANYHSIDDVMNDTEHHLYIDNSEVKRNCKVYITDQPSTSSPDSKNEIDLLGDLYTLTTDGLEGHNTVSDYIRNCDNLDIIFSDNVQPKGTWTSIGSSGKCFAGNLHGDGNYISGLDHSLFDYFCGNVYNLGIEGSFTGAGLAENGGGDAVNCWMLTSGTPDSEKYPFFGDGGGILSNCYYADDYKDASAIDSWSVHRKPVTSFNNGDVAYNLNSYFLRKRYNDRPSSGLTENAYNYYIIDKTDGHLMKAESHAASGDADFTYIDADNIVHNIGYVESRFIDGDFVYSDGVIRNEADEHLDEAGTYYPIYPDDYIYFGQKLSYNMLGSEYPHQEYPMAIARNTENRMLTGNNASTRVYRAPAYFGNKNMSAAYFNVNVVLPSVYTKTDVTVTSVTDEYHGDASGDGTETHEDIDGRVKTTTTTETTTDVNIHQRTVVTTVKVETEKDAYLGLTAIDFTGQGDIPASRDNEVFGFTPVLDYEGLIGFNNRGQTRNMLTYADAVEPDAASYGILSSYFSEPSMTSGTYNTVDEVSETDISNIYGHLVNGNKAAGSHYLVDLQEFNAPIGYQFNPGDYMWYQRKPDNFASLTSSASESFSLPFEVDMLTTQTKGELTHFYEGSEKGHEYWLRSFDAIASSDATVATADFKIPAMGSGSKTDNNTFLWDTYYSKDDSKDKNSDKYFEYYKQPRTYENYPKAQAATPYLLGLPGADYYEFDLSGNFEPQNEFGLISKIDKQVVTMVSASGATIGVSDDELAEGVTTAGGFSYTPNYNNRAIPAGSFVLNDSGTAYEVTFEAVAPGAFRPYFVRAAAGANERYETRSIIFGKPEFQKGNADDPVSGLVVYVKGSNIVVESGLDYDRQISIITSSGISVSTFVIMPGERRVTNVPGAGVYMVAGHKVLVK